MIDGTEQWLFEVEPGVVIDTRPGAYLDEQGCDLSLIDATLERSLRERLRALRGLADVVWLEYGDARVPVLGLERLIAVKRAAGRPKDLRVLPELEATLRRVRARDR